MSYDEVRGAFAEILGEEGLDEKIEQLCDSCGLINPRVIALLKCLAALDMDDWPARVKKLRAAA